MKIVLSSTKLHFEGISVHLFTTRNIFFIFRNKYTNPIFFIVSNNMKWCKKNIMGDDIIYPGTLLDQLMKKNS